MSLPQRKHPRLKNYDYSQCGCYHLIICTKDRRPLLSKIISPPSEAERASVSLLSYGMVAEKYIQNIPAVYTGVELPKYVIMPNHVHLLIVLQPTSTVSVFTIIRSLKRMINRDTGASVWQESFYDTIIRNDSVFQCEWEYIDSNPDKWSEDELYTEND